MSKFWLFICTILLGGCTAVATVPSAPTCKDLYSEFNRQKTAYDLCKREARCYWTYRDLKETQELENSLFECYKEKRF